MKILKNKYFSFFIRLLLTVLMFIWIFHKIDMTKLKDTFLSLPLYSIIGVMLAIFFVMVFCIIRWKWLLNAINKEVKWGFLTKAYWIGFFMNNFLPASVGMDIVRSAYISDNKEETAKIVGTTIVERLLGFVGIFVFTVMGIIFLLFTSVNIPYIEYALILSIIGIIGFVFLFYVFYHPKVYGYINKLLAKIKFMNIGNLLNHIYDSFVYYKGKNTVIIYNILISSIIQGSLVTGVFFIGKGLGLDVPFTHYLIYVPLIMIISTLPLTINGMGLRELSFIYLFALSGVQKENAVLMSLILFFATIFISLPGGLLLLLKRK